MKGRSGYLGSEYALYVHGKYTLALGKEREIVKEETALRKEKEAVCCYVHVGVVYYVPRYCRYKMM